MTNELSKHEQMIDALARERFGETESWDDADAASKDRYRGYVREWLSDIAKAGYRVVPDKPQTLIACTTCGRGYPAREMVTLPDWTAYCVDCATELIQRSHSEREPTIERMLADLRRWNCYLLIQTGYWDGDGFVDRSNYACIELHHHCPNWDQDIDGGLLEPTGDVWEYDGNLAAIIRQAWQWAKDTITEPCTCRACLRIAEAEKATREAERADAEKLASDPPIVEQLARHIYDQTQAPDTWDNAHGQSQLDYLELARGLIGMVERGMRS